MSNTVRLLAALVDGDHGNGVLLFVFIPSYSRCVDREVDYYYSYYHCLGLNVIFKLCIWQTS